VYKKQLAMFNTCTVTFYFLVSDLHYLKIKENTFLSKFSYHLIELKLTIHQLAINNFLQ